MKMRAMNEVMTRPKTLTATKIKDPLPPEKQNTSEAMNGRWFIPPPSRKSYFSGVCITVHSI
jgi:hypothetical protein